jgi:hypothetical protein
MITAFVIGSVADATAGLPVEHLRRRATGVVATVAGLLSAALVLGLVAGNVAGNVTADGLAARAWGPAGRRA